MQVENKLNNVRASMNLPGIATFELHQISSSGYELKQDSIFPDRVKTPGESDNTFIRHRSKDKDTSMVTNNKSFEFDN